VHGYTNYLWNGISTKIFSQIVEQIILIGFKEPKTQHIVPDNWLSKFQILQHIAEKANRLDLKIIPIELKKSIDLRLATEFSDFNSLLFNLAGYSKLPTIQEMIDAMF
jgi:dTDP-4-dehydrorhamnose reductase